ncbi:MAG: hypothetical protein DDT29_02549 [Dehalococcoidia bacterium]|nr:hypothetical protein [Bacillota bacterium]
MEGLIYKLELDEDDDYAVIDYTVSEVNPHDYVVPPRVNGKTYFATEGAAIEFARGQLTDMKKCSQCGERHRTDKQNPCFCVICGYPTSNGHWHPGTG